MAISRLTFLTFILFTNLVFGQKSKGVVISPKGDSIAFVEIFVLGGNNERIAGTDIDGHFTFDLYGNPKIYAKYFDCYSDTILVTNYKRNNLKLTIKISTACASKLEITNCRHDFFYTGAYYVDLNDLTIVSYEEIMTKKEYSPFDYEIIEKDKKYLSDNGKVFSGEELISQKHLPSELWKNSNFNAIEEEKKVKLTPIEK